MNADQTDPLGAIRSGSILLAIQATQEHEQTRQQTTKVMTGGKRGKVYDLEFNLGNFHLISDEYKTLPNISPIT